ncbi:16S rRNA (cytosine(1402)-N(4))-methyltransferase RsmH [Patescibacteria group bacterium]|nr:16S rRNA (cytosine(1402)-N(4))-methyltransferase RsmH [Patescibacteria group bacterium]
MFHKPVLLSEVVEFLSPKQNEHLIDCNLGGGGHAATILEKTSPSGKLIGIDLDLQALAEARDSLQQYGDRFVPVNDTFGNLDEIVLNAGISPISGVLFDLGLSSFQLDQSGRGFSFKRTEPLDMRFSESRGKTAADVVNEYSFDELRALFKEYGELKNNAKLARHIVMNRDTRVETTSDLCALAKEAMPRFYIGKENKYLAQVFQSLRIEVNNELEELKKGLTAALSVVKPKGRVAVISYHSLEDRVVKQLFRAESKECICPPKSPLCICEHEQRVEVLTRKPVVPSEKEISTNPRGRSAKLRVVEKR